jgi:hypothetical protein
VIGDAVVELVEKRFSGRDRLAQGRLQPLLPADVRPGDDAADDGAVAVADRAGIAQDRHATAVLGAHIPFLSAHDLARAGRAGEGQERRVRERTVGGGGDLISVRMKRRRDILEPGAVALQQRAAGLADAQDRHVRGAGDGDADRDMRQDRVEQSRRRPVDQPFDRRVRRRFFDGQLRVQFRFPLCWRSDMMPERPPTVIDRVKPPAPGEGR